MVSGRRGEWQVARRRKGNTENANALPQRTQRSHGAYGEEKREFKRGREEKKGPTLCTKRKG
jgi:hypothetical protein